MNIKHVKYCREELLYKVFGLFPFYRYDDNGNIELCKGNTMPDGCYNQLSCSFKLPQNINLTINGTELLSSGVTYNYSTLHKYYLRYSHLKNNPFISWMNNGLGLVKIPQTIDKTEHDLVPDYVNMCECQNLLDEMVKMSIVCTNYKNSDESSCEMDCLCDKYHRMGGDEILDFYRQQVEEADIIATSLLDCVDDENIADFKINLNITQSLHDMGSVENYIDIWNPFANYHNGDIVTYDGDSYICIADETSDNFIQIQPNAFGEFIFNSNAQFIKIGTLAMAYNLSSVDEVSNRLCTFQHNNMLIYIWNPYGTYDIGDAMKYDGKMYTCISTSEIEVTVDDDNYTFNNVTVGPIIKNYDIRVSGQTNSKLKSFRKYGDYVSPLGVIETPGLYEDWLYYYKINYLAHYDVNRNDVGNIALITDESERVISVPTTGEYNYEMNLDAYGDILTDIQYDTDAHTITFTYMLGAHLKAPLVNVSCNYINQTIYHYGDFEYDETDNYHGVKYTETYRYDTGGEIDELIENNNFETYVTTVALNTQTTAGLEYVVGSFDTFSAVQTEYTEINGQVIPFNYMPTSFTTIIKSDRDYSWFPLIRSDYYDGFGYNPIINNHIAFSRGNAAAFERHIKLGEVKSFDDFMNYANGGFFNVR